MWITSVFIRLSEGYVRSSNDDKMILVLGGSFFWPVYFLVISSRWATNKVKELHDSEEDES